jgi:hypothetical protein
MTFTDSSPESSPEKTTIKPRPKEPSNSKDSDTGDESFDESYTPVVDNMVYDVNKCRATLIVSAKRGSNMNSKDIEQLNHEMVSMLPLDGSKGRVGGLLICQSLAQFRIANKCDTEIELALVKEFDFEAPNICSVFHTFVGYLISFNKYCKE